MRFLHTSDWHIGKKLNDYDLLLDQEAMIEQMLQLAIKEQVDALVIAGDIYDRSIPPETAVHLYNKMIKKINLEAKIPILAISGNHDSSERLNAGNSWFEATNYFLKTKLAESFTPVVLKDTQFFLLPYFEPIDARLYFENDELRTIQQAMPHVLNEMQKQFDPAKKHVLITHFFVAGSTRYDSETKVEVGGLASIPTDLLDIFDYTALGHLHGKDALQLAKARYSGSLLKYSLSEINQDKGAWLIDFDQEDWLVFKPLQPVRDIKKISGFFHDLLQPTPELIAAREHFVHIEILDTAIIPGLMNQLREVFPYILSLERLHTNIPAATDSKRRKLEQENPETLVAEFFHAMAGTKLAESQVAMIQQGLQAVKKESEA